MNHKHSIFSLILVMLLLLAACAPNMSNYVPRDKNLVFEPKAESVVIVQLPYTKKGMLKSDDFRQAVIDALKHANLFSTVLDDGSAEYELKVDLLSHQDTAFGLDMTNSTIANYELKKIDSGKIVYVETINSSHTATVSDACVGAKRNIKATEGSVQANIKKFIWNLSKIEL